jgi:precorrin-2/cobalt-factor-2 C20-methyltransferase
VSKGKLYGIGTGPGDPELLTLKAIRVIEQCDIIAVPGHSGEDRTALGIVEAHIAGKELLEVHFAMSRNMEERVAARLAAAQSIIDKLEQGHDVGFITLGDTTTYSTYMYVHEYIVTAGYEAEIIPGVTSFAAAAAALGIALCSGDETLTIIPARHSLDISELLDMPGNKVIMKSSENLRTVLAELKARGLNANTKVASRVTMDGQALFNSIDEFEQSDEGGYFTLAIVKEGN